MSGVLAQASKPAKKNLVDELVRHEKLGWPMIPSKGNMSLPESKSVLRAYVTGTYRTPFHFLNFDGIYCSCLRSVH